MSNFVFNLQNHHTFHSEERLVNLEKGREFFIGLSILYTVLVYAVQYSIIIYLGKTAHSWSLCLGSSAQAAEHSGKLQEGHQYSPCTWV